MAFGSTSFGELVGSSEGASAGALRASRASGALPEAVYLVVPFLADEAGSLRPGAPRRSLSRRNAIALADGLAPFCDGVLVLRGGGDVLGDAWGTAWGEAWGDASREAGRCAGRDLVCVIGDVPGELVRRLAA